MTPATLYFEMATAARTDHRLTQWIRRNKRRIVAVVGPAALEGTWVVGLTLPLKPLSSDNTAAGLVASSVRAQQTQTERAVEYLWQTIASPFDTAISLTGLRGGADSGEGFISTVRTRALNAANGRSTSGPANIEGAYTILLRWLGRWDADFEAAQAAAETRASEAIDRVRAIRERAQSQSPEAPVRSARPRRRVEASVPPTVHDALLAELRRRSGSVLDRHVRQIDSNRFKSYGSVLHDAFVAAGGTESDLTEALRRGDIEVLTEEGGYGGGRGPGEARARIIEYVVHSWDEMKANPARRSLGVK